MLKDKIYSTVRKRAMHFTLIDPEKIKNLGEKCSKLKKMGTDAVMVGGSTNVTKKDLEYTLDIIRKHKLSSLLFPGDVSGVSSKADAILFMSLMNSRNSYWITGAQASASQMVKKSGLEVLPMGYLVFEPGGTVGCVGEANLIKDAKTAVSYACAVELMGMSLVYLEAGSGAEKMIPVSTIKAVRKSVNIPILVGGGIRTAKDAKLRAEAGADIIVTGNVSEDNFDKMESIVRAVKGVKRQ
jgi:phosphoglycerol geranylgeranyltransferase